MAGKKIKVHCVDFGGMLKPEHNIFCKWLKENNLYEHDRTNPDILLFSVFGYEHLNFDNCIKVLFSGENRKVNSNEYHFSVCFGDNSDTNLFFPNIFSWHLSKTSIPSDKLLSVLKKKNTANNHKDKKFCNFIYHVDWEGNLLRKTPRKEFCKQLQKYKHVDCPGNVLNNMQNFGTGRSGNWAEEKYQFIKDYKFTIAFENESACNYVSEKIFHPLLAGNIPIYWGAPNINEFFNPRCFINASNFNTYSSIIEYIKNIDNDDDLYQSFFEEPPVLVNSKLNGVTEERINNFFSMIISNVT